MFDAQKHAEPIQAAELIQLCATDNRLFSTVFFPNTVRQVMPAFHLDMWTILESSSRLVNIRVFRGGAKTTMLRIYATKRIAYGLARTIVVVGKSEAHAIRSVRWIRRQIERNRTLCEVFKLSPGKKWQDHECEILHGLEGHTVTIIALGVTGSVRGVNIDDYRPDLIIVDDVLDEENSATPEQRAKMEALLYGALKNSLTPASEAPDAKMVMLQTPLDREDASTKAVNDPEWRSASFGIWTDETKDLPLDQQESRWPERYPSETMRAEKRAHIRRNQLSIWYKEFECLAIAPENNAFRADWLRYYDILPEGLTIILAIDPVPPPSEVQIAKGFKDKDYEAFAVLGRKGNDVYLLEYAAKRGHEPNWTTATFFNLMMKWKPRRAVVETVAYQRTLIWILKQEMERQRKFYVINEFTDKRKKYNLIVDALSALASNGKFWVRREHAEFISQFQSYPHVSHDDVINAVAIGAIELMGGAYHTDGDTLDAVEEEEKNIKPLEYNMELMAP